jgi:hypothetical protein
MRLKKKMFLFGYIVGRKRGNMDKWRFQNENLFQMPPKEALERIPRKSANLVFRWHRLKWIGRYDREFQGGRVCAEWSGGRFRCP